MIKLAAITEHFPIIYFIYKTTTSTTTDPCSLFIRCGGRERKGEERKTSAPTNLFPSCYNGRFPPLLLLEITCLYTLPHLTDSRCDRLIEWPIHGQAKTPQNDEFPVALICAERSSQSPNLRPSAATIAFCLLNRLELRCAVFCLWFPPPPPPTRPWWIK